MKRIPQLKILILSAFLVIFASVFTPSVRAAETYFEVIPNIQLGAKFESGFFLNTSKENINTIGGKVTFPENLLELKEIKDGNSIINFWIERPKGKNGEVSFSGIIPGGYTYEKGLIFSLVFQAKQEGRGSIEIKNIEVLLNNGKGTEATTTISNSQFTISKQATSTPMAVEKPDVYSPEEFKPVIVTDPNVFDGKYFLIFNAQDKGSGIDRYEVCEGMSSKCLVAESPYLLQNQNLDLQIFVKAIDKSGNTRVVVLPAQARNMFKVYASIAVFVGLVLFIAILSTRTKNRKKKK